MKYTSLVVLLSLLLIGCSKKEATPAGTAMDSKATTATDSGATTATGSKATSTATDSQAAIAMDLIQSGTVTTWGKTVLRVAKRADTSLEGVTVETKLWNGEIDIVTADTATFSTSPDAKHSVIIDLHNAKTKSGESITSLGEMQIRLDR